MNMKLKALVGVAVASMVMSSAASAGINTSSGGELFVMAYDTGSQNTFVATLDSLVSTASAFTGTSNLSKSFAGDANWVGFTGAAGFNAANVTYQVLGMDTSSNSLWTTSTNMSTNAGINTNYNNIAAPAGFVQAWMNAYAGAPGGSSVLLPANSSAAANGTAPQMGSNWSNYLPNFTTTAALGSNDNFYKLSKNGTFSLNQLTKTTYMQADGVTNGAWNLASNGALTYTASVVAVPEADTWAMMLAGLGLMGFIARRRSSV